MHLKYFPRNTLFLSFDRLSHSLYLFKKEPAYVPFKKKHWQTFLWSEECLSSQLKVTKMWFGRNVKYLGGRPFLQIFAARKASLDIFNLHIFLTIFDFMLITCHNSMACNLESHAIAIKHCCAMQHPHMWCTPGL